MFTRGYIAVVHGEVPPGVPATDRIVEIGGRPDAKAEGDGPTNRPTGRDILGELPSGKLT